MTLRGKSLVAQFIVLWVLISGGSWAAMGQDVAAAIARLQAAATLPLTTWKYESSPVGHEERADFDDHAWPDTRPGASVPTKMFWLRTRFELPASLAGNPIEGARADLSVLVYGEGMLYVNGVQVADLHSARIVVPLSSEVKAGQKFVIAIRLIPESVSVENNKLGDVHVAFTPPPSRPDPAGLARDLGVVSAFVEGDREFASRHKAVLDSALAKIDFDALKAGDAPRFDASLRAASRELQPLQDDLKRYTLLLTGQSHIDMAWLWPWSETVDVVRNTFRSALYLMKVNPDFTYTQSQAAAYAWIEEKYPDIFEEIRQRVKEGRWELAGGMWVEPDLNLPDGESLVRQILYGKRYFRDKFGVDVRVGWNPDTFGYNWQMPQIYKKSGIDYFMTIKLAYNDATKFPHRLFWWQAPDGSRVLAYFPNKLDAGTDPVTMAGYFPEIAGESGTKEIMYLYGVGDHGGGPTQQAIDGVRETQTDNLFPNLKFSTALPFFESLGRNASGLNIPVWNDELYFEYHRGVYTTHAQMKRYNRKNEVLLANAEKFSVLDRLFGQPYPQGTLNENWKKLLFNQFHDILPGSAIAAAYADATREQRQVESSATRVLEKSIVDLAAQVDTRGQGIPLLVFNPLAWSRSEVVEAEVEFPQMTRDFQVTDSQGRPVLHQVVKREDRLRRVRFLFLAQDVPSLGYKTFRVIPGASGATAAKSPLKLDAGTLTLENEFFRVRVGAKSGLIESLYDKTRQREAFDQTHRGNLLQTFVDKPKEWDAWNIDADFEKVKWDLDAAESVQVIERGPVRAVIRVVKKFQDSRFIQDISLYPGVPRVDCAMQVDWHEKHILLKAAFPLSVSSPAATYEIPFGAIRRPTNPQTPAERAKFEVPALRWADLSDGGYGVSILNESKYGYDTKDNILRLTLLRSTAWPDPHPDDGLQEFTYAIYPHSGGWEQAGTVRRGYELNVPLLARAETGHTGSLPAAKSFLSVEGPSIILAAMKKAEDDEGIVLRLYAAGENAKDAILSLPQAVKEAQETDLMERPLEPLTPEGNRLRLEFKPYEIKTVKVRL